MTYLDRLNPSQQQAALHMQGPLLLFAGAGSGKTRVLTYRVARLIEEGVDPYHIIAITFTNKAAKEMRERITAITPLGEQVWVSTFHAACTRILRREISALGYERGFSIYDTQDSLRLIKDCIKERNLCDASYPPRNVAQVISAQKNELISPEQYERDVAGSFRESNIADVYNMYQQRLKSSNALDFDDIIFQTVELLSRHEDIRDKYQNRFRYVMVDEYQDTNHAQYELVRLLSGYAQNLCVVGDDDQSIYGWRGADIKNILRFESDYPGATVVKLEQNYRSSQVILDAANAVISKNEARADKRLWTENGRGELIRIYTATDERDEGAFVARVIGEGVKQGARLNDFAILYRTNAQSRSVEDALVMAGIPYRIFGGTRFYEHMEIKDILAYLKAINNPADDMAFLRIINVPRRGIGTASISKVQVYAMEKGLTFYTAILQAENIPGLGKKAADVKKFADFLVECADFTADHSVAELMRKIIDDTDYMRTIVDDTPEGDEREANILELLAKARAFENESDDTSLAKFLEDVALVADIDNYQEDANAVALMTLHSAKGLEFHSVFMVGFEDELFPTIRSMNSGQTPEMEEERRLCYVGFTRARNILYLTHALSRRRFDKTARNAPSRFLTEVPKDCVTAVNAYGKPRETRQSVASFQSNPSFASERSVASQGFMPQRRPQKSTVTSQQISTTNAFAPKQAPPRPVPKGEPPDFTVGDKIRTTKYGEGEVLAIEPAGADYEVTIHFATAGRKKFMANFLQVTKSE